MADLLLEIFSEEIPARMQAAAASRLLKSIADGLDNASGKSFVTPRRIAVIISDLPEVQPDVTLEIKGPKVGAPEVAINGFLKKNNLKMEQVEERDGVYFATIHEQGKPTTEIIKPLIEETLLKFSWPKSMRWGEKNESWVRPLHNILCIFNWKNVPVEFAGIIGNNVTYGHRFLAPEKIVINSAEDYENLLEKSFVIADRDKRKSLIIKQAHGEAATYGLTIKTDEPLLEEVTGLVEYPNILVGKIDGEFMDLPPEVLATVMRSHQKYFALQDSAGKLSSYFVITSNMRTEDDGKSIISGNERVLRARFSDARFFWNSDRNKPLSDWAEGLKSVTYHAKLGTIADKVKRITKIALEIVKYLPKADPQLVHRAALLCKADLVTGMVGEFPELQGIMGRYYALQQKEQQSIADAICDHYKPAGASDGVPTNPVSVCVALADKLDTLNSMFSIGEKPTGSKDPFALRRAALGVIRILLENNIHLPLSEFVSSELMDFFHERLKVQLRDSGIRYDAINAVIGSGDDDILLIKIRAEDLQEFLKQDESINLLAAYRRAANIVSAEQKKDKTSYFNKNIDKSILEQEEEKNLLLLLKETESTINNLINQNKFTESMLEMTKFRVPLDQFFDKIMVNCENKNLRIARLSILCLAQNIMNKVANFSQIEG
ncbi:MAG: glycine--tRNA ligase subunit beta [Rickettsiales bacterium]